MSGAEKTFLVIPLYRRSGQLADLLQHLAGFRESALFMLIENQFPVHRHLENAAVAFFQVRLRREFLFDRGRQTGGLRQIISLPAVGDLDFQRIFGWSRITHDDSPFLVCYLEIPFASIVTPGLTKPAPVLDPGESSLIF